MSDRAVDTGNFRKPLLKRNKFRFFEANTSFVNISDHLNCIHYNKVVFKYQMCRIDVISLATLINETDTASIKELQLLSHSCFNEKV